jgi:nitronate monooxygenase
VQTLAAADAVVGGGADVLVAQGNEAGGHTGTMGLLPFLAAVVARHPDIPVLAAGGIGNGRTLAAALTAGADGAWLGTVLLATPEVVEIHDDRKRLIVESDGGDTVYTRAYDIVSGLPWPAGVGERVRRNRFTEEWADREAELRDRREEIPPEGRNPFMQPPDPDRSEVIFGQAAAFVDEIRPAADVVRTVSRDAEEILRSRAREILG